jgi:hypothetical protein
LGRVNNDNPREPIDFINAKCSNYDNVSIESDENLQPGEYIALIEIEWK